jgi:N,N'-diacetyllegionaminate synthase
VSVYIIAEIGSTHDGSLGIAKNSATVARECGADSAKFQTHIAAAETIRNAPAPSYFSAEPRFEYFNRTAFNREQHRALKAHCDEQGIEFISSPFSAEAVELLEDVGIARYKIPSGEVSNAPLMEVVAQTGKPVILSSGMSSWAELDRAVNIFVKQGNELAVLQCTSTYPCPYDRVGLNVMLEMKARYGVPVGLSDHTLTNYACFTAVALGATIVEKHFTLSKRLYGSDAKHSAEPDQLRDLVDGIRAIEVLTSSQVDKSDASPFADMKRIFEKSVVTIAPLPAGTVLDRAMLGIKKPGTGIPAARIGEVVGRRLRHAVEADAVLTDADLDS